MLGKLLLSLVEPYSENKHCADEPLVVSFDTRKIYSE